MADAITVELSNDGLAPHLSSLHAQISEGTITGLTLDLTEARNFGAFDLQALIHLDRAAKTANISIQTQGASTTQTAILASRTSSPSTLSELI